jgi:hypothetical protein
LPSLPSTLLFYFCVISASSHSLPFLSLLLSRSTKPRFPVSPLFSPPLYESGETPSLLFIPYHITQRPGLLLHSAHNASLESYCVVSLSLESSFSAPLSYHIAGPCRSNRALPHHASLQRCCATPHHASALFLSFLLFSLGLQNTSNNIGSGSSNHIATQRDHGGGRPSIGFKTRVQICPAMMTNLGFWAVIVYCHATDYIGSAPLSSPPHLVSLSHSSYQ